MKRFLCVALLTVFMVSGCSFPIGSKNKNANNQSPDATPIASCDDIYPDELIFSPFKEFERPEYQELTDKQKNIYILLDNALYNMQTGFIPIGRCSQTDFELALKALRNDRPEYFWIPNNYTMRLTGNAYEICFAEKEQDWHCTKAERKQLESKIKAELTEFSKTLTADMTEFERELAAHDWLCEKISYDHSALKKPDERFFAWTIVGAFIYDKAVCEGYSRAMQVLLNICGIKSSLVTGTTTEGHMWNTVKIDGKWYHLDATSNDGDSTVYHFFFNVTTEYLKKGRTLDPLFSSNDVSNCNTFLPSCTSNDNNYHVKKSLYIGSKAQIEPTIVSLVCDAIRSGRRSVEFSVDPEIGFVFGKGDVVKTFKLEKCIAAVNSELDADQRLRSYTYSGIDGAMGFVISW